MLPKPSLRATIWHRWLGRPFKLHVKDVGQGPVIIFLHGIASSSDNWRLVTPLLPGYRCITIDLLGFGRSPKPQWLEYTMDNHIKAVNHVIKKLHLKQPYTLVGHSLGSLLAVRYARMYPRLVQRLVLLSPPVYAPLYTIQSRAARSRTNFYLKAYKFLRSHRRATPDNILRLQKLLPMTKLVAISKDNWIPFTRTLEHCIEQQTLIDDIAHVPLPTDVFYGVFDEVVVAYNVKQLGRLAHISLHELRVSHAVGKRYAGAVAAILQQPASDKLVEQLV